MTKEAQKAAIRALILQSMDLIDLIIDQGDETGEGPGIDDVLAVNQPISEPREIDITGQKIVFRGANVFLEINDIDNFIIMSSNNQELMIVNGVIRGDFHEFADNAAALAGGVPDKGLYFSNEGTEQIIKQAHD